MNLVAKHLITVSKPIQVEPFLGVDIVYLKEHITDNYAGTDPVYGPYTDSTYVESHYTGFLYRPARGSTLPLPCPKP